jgi:MoaA/NifB/PqqE/SkfB family radical SAM enzyme
MKPTFESIKHAYCFHAFNSYSCYSSGAPRPCCVMQGQFDTGHAPPAEQTIADSLNADILKNLRRQMLKGEKPKECKYCWDMEAQGMQSLRQDFNKNHFEAIAPSLELVTDEGMLDPKAVSFVDLTLGNICNLKCRSCNPWSSSQWLEEFQLLPQSVDIPISSSDILKRQSWLKKNLNLEFFEPVRKTLRHINFLGGEPLMVKEHESLLQSLVDTGDAKNITLSYNTNGIFLPQSLFKIWPHFKFVHLGLSVDAVGPLAYYVRFPSDFSKIESNLLVLNTYCLEHQNLAVQTHATLSVLNMHALCDLLMWCKKQYESWAYTSPHSFGYQNLIPHFNVVTHPDFLHMRLIPEEIKKQIQLEITQLIKELSSVSVQPWESDHFERLESLKNFLDLKGDALLWQKFLENTSITDKFRKVNICDYIPWVSEYL